MPERKRRKKNQFSDVKSGSSTTAAPSADWLADLTAEPSRRERMHPSSRAIEDFARRRIADMRSESPLPAALISANPTAEQRDVLISSMVDIAGSVNPASRIGKVVAKKAAPSVKEVLTSVGERLGNRSGRGGLTSMGQRTYDEVIRPRLQRQAAAPAAPRAGFARIRNVQDNPSEGITEPSKTFTFDVGERQVVAEVTDMGKHLYITDMKVAGAPKQADGTFNLDNQNKVGPREVRSILSILAGEFPEAKRAYGYRATGARWGPAADRAKTATVGSLEPKAVGNALGKWDLDQLRKNRPGLARIPSRNRGNPRAAEATPAPAAAPRMLKVEHFSERPDLDVLDPKHQGTGQAGQERARASRPKAMHLYDASQPKKFEERFRGKYRYTSEIDESRLYDLEADPDGIKAKAITAAARRGTPGDRAGIADAVERRIKKAGYLGYRGLEGDSNIIKIFEPLEVTPAAPTKVRGKRFGADNPEVGLRAQAEDFLSRLRSDGGFTLDGRGRPVTSGFSVGAGKLPGSQLLQTPLADLTVADVTNYLRKSPDGVIHGGWVDNGVVYIEPATLVKERDAALRLGAERGEKAVGDLDAYARGDFDAGTVRVDQPVASGNRPGFAGAGAPTPDEPERIYRPAYRAPDGTIFEGANHYFANEKAWKAGKADPAYIDEAGAGYTTTTGRWVDRQEADEIAVRMEQKGEDPEGNTIEGSLATEDLINLPPARRRKKGNRPGFVGPGAPTPDEPRFLTDDKGNPLEVYHGTGADDFDSFRTPAYFTANEDYARMFGDERARDISPLDKNASGAVIPANLALKNPFDARGDETYWRTFRESKKSEIARLKAAGHDGILMREATEDGELADVFVAFDPSQIRRTNRPGFAAVSPAPNSGNVLDESRLGRDIPATASTERPPLYRAPRADFSVLDNVLRRVRSVYTPNAERALRDDPASAGWYDTSQLRQLFEEQSPTGTQDFEMFSKFMGPTSAGTNVPKNISEASYWYNQWKAGEINAGNMRSRTAAKDFDIPAGYASRHQFGRNVGIANILEEGDINPIEQPKIWRYAHGIFGDNWGGAPLDIHVGRQVGVRGTFADGSKGRGFPTASHPTTGQIETSPLKTHYAPIEDAVAREAEKLGVAPIQYQSAGWVGGSEGTGVTDARPLISLFNDKFRRTAKKYGYDTPLDAAKAFAKGETPLWALVGAAGLGQFANDQESP